MNIYFNFLGYIPKSGIAGSNDKCMFNFKTNCQSLTVAGPFSIPSHQQCINDPVSPHPHQYLVLSIFILAVL